MYDLSINSLIVLLYNYIGIHIHSIIYSTKHGHEEHWTTCGANDTTERCTLFTKQCVGNKGNPSTNKKSTQKAYTMKWKWSETGAIPSNELSEMEPAWPSTLPSPRAGVDNKLLQSGPPDTQTRVWRLSSALILNWKYVHAEWSTLCSTW